MGFIQYAVTSRFKLPSFFNTKRIHPVTAMLGAVLVHLMILGLGSWGLKQISIPSNEERLLVLTLESTPLDGIKQGSEALEESIDDLDSGGAPSAVLNDEVVDDGTDVEPASVDESTSNQPRSKKSIAELGEAPSLEQVGALPSVAQPLNAAPESLIELPQPPVFNDSNISLLGSRQKNQQSLLTAMSGQLTLAERYTKVEAKQPANVSLTSEQRDMLGERVEQWINGLDLTGRDEGVTSWEEQGQIYQANLRREPARGEMDLDQMVVDIVTQIDGRRVSTQMRMKKLAFSSFAQFVHRWSPDVRIHDDEMDGRFHSNSRISIEVGRDTKPVFHGKVTTASRQIDIERYRGVGKRASVFRGGLETGVKRINMPEPQHLFATVNVDGSQNERLFSQPTRIIFRPDGSYLWHATDLHGPPRLGVLGVSPIRFAAAKGVELRVSGVVSGKVLIYSPQRILIEGDLTYANFSPNDGLPDSRDGSVERVNLTGLVSGKDIVIAGPDLTGTGDLHIHASIYARRRLVVRRYSARNQGTLHLFGSVSVGALSATEPRYATNIVFDKRLEDIRPPGFPVTDRYELAMYADDWQPELETSSVSENIEYLDGN